MMQKPRKRRDHSVPKPTESKPTANPSNQLFVTWESEVRLIAEEAARWKIETGGDLFGLWADSPTVYLATRAGPAAVRDAAHFRLDVEYLKALSNALAEEWGLQYLGDWHSHHRLGLITPSTGDRRRIGQVARRNNLERMAEVIVTFDDAEDPNGDFAIRLHSWFYADACQELRPQPANVAVVSGVSPVREAMVARGLLPEQQLDSWAAMPLARTRVGSDSTAPVLTVPGPVEAWLGETIVKQAKRALERASGQPVESHPTPFGFVFVAAADAKGEEFVAMAFDGGWPPRLLEVDWINRAAGTAEPLSKPLGLESLLDPLHLAQAYDLARELRNSKPRAGHVDNGPA